MEFIDFNFNLFSSISYWIAFLVIVVIINVLDFSYRWRSWLTGLASLFMLLAIPDFGIKELTLVLTLTVMTYLSGSWLIKSAPRLGPVSVKRKLITGLGISGVLCFLAFFKYRFIQQFVEGDGGLGAGITLHAIRLIGVSYFSFRMIHFLIESYRNKIDSLNLLAYINYVIFFPSFISGPINRYNHFVTRFSSNADVSKGEDIRAGAEKIVHGLFKKFVMAQIFFPYILSTQHDALAEMGITGVVTGLYAYALYFYYDFAGYTDMAIGCGRLLRIDLPENFNNPFLKRNIRELWTNWHMSLTSWLVDYIYWPIVRKLRGIEFFRQHPIALSNLGMIVTFVVCGMWHGETVNFILWGAYHGIGISILTIYQREKRKVKSPAFMRYLRSPMSAIIGIFLTFNYFAFGLLLFVLDIKAIHILFDNLLRNI